MEWWTDLWLNEGFATWVGNMAADHFYPEWNVWESFISNEFNRALDLDQLDSSHPIQVTVNKASEVDEIFDEISYSKGASVIRMLVNFLGEDTFRDGIRAYLNKYKYSNAKTENLWEELSTASGRDINSMMDSWTAKTGYPLVTVERNNLDVTVKQKRYNASDDTIWHIPLNTMTGSYDNIHKHLLESNQEKLSLNVEWFKMNANCSGLYRVKYSVALLNKLKYPIETKKLSPIDRTELMSNLFSFAKLGYETTGVALDFVNAYKSEDSLIVIETLLEGLNDISDVWVGSDVSIKNKMKLYQINLFKDLYDSLGWKETLGEAHSNSILRRLIISRLGELGYEPVLAEGRKLFPKLVTGDTSDILPDLIQAVLSMCVKHGGKEEYEAVKQLFEESTLDELQGNCLIAIGCVQTPELVKKCFDYALNDDHVRMQDMFRTISSLTDGFRSKIVWDCVFENWSTICDKLKEGKFLFGRVVTAPLTSIYNKKLIDNAKIFFASKKSDVEDIQRTINQSLEKVNNSIEWLERDNSDVVAFFESF